MSVRTPAPVILPEGTHPGTPTSLTLSSLTSLSPSPSPSSTPAPPALRPRLPKAPVFVRTPPTNLPPSARLSDLSSSSSLDLPPHPYSRRYDFNDDFASVADSDLQSATATNTPSSVHPARPPPAALPLPLAAASRAPQRHPHNLLPLAPPPLPPSPGAPHPHPSLGSTLKYAVPPPSPSSPPPQRARARGSGLPRSRISFRARASKRVPQRPGRDDSVLHDWRRAEGERRHKQLLAQRRRRQQGCFAFWRAGRKGEVQREAPQGREVVTEDVQFVSILSYEEFMHGGRRSPVGKFIARIRGH